MPACQSQAYTSVGMMGSMAIPVVEFLREGFTIRRFLAKNQHTQIKLLNFKYWRSSELSKIRKFPMVIDIEN